MNAFSDLSRARRATWLVGLASAALMSGCNGGGDDDGKPVSALPQYSPQSQCDALVGRRFEEAVVTKASLVSAASGVPEHCLVQGEMPQALAFLLQLPTQWNKRTVFLGGGNFDGVLSIPVFEFSVSPDLKAAGYALISTNQGHNGITAGDATFASNPGMLHDWAYAAVPRVMAPAKAILRERYGSEFEGTKTVFEGCSGGGRHALIQAQRHPDLFDGVIAREPALSFNALFLRYQTINKVLAQPGGTLGALKIQAIDKAVMAKCDSLDGVVDNIIGKPQSCNFDPVELACTGAESASCLTPAQVRSARSVYAATSVANGRYTMGGFYPGGELQGWNESIWTDQARDYITGMVAQSPSVDWLNLDPAAYTSRIDQLATMIDAEDPDLSRFKASGGKLLLWQGLSDALVSAKHTTAYYESVVQKMNGQAATDDFMEYYTAPSVGHCGFESTGADKVNLVGPMFDWIEKGIKPATTQIVATQRTVPAGAAPGTRPLCRYPQYPRYIGGDVKVAASFACTAP